jgi:DNA-binding NtrC family response regulator
MKLTAPSEAGRILIAIAEAASRRAVARALRTDGYDCHAVRDGLEAYTRLQGSPPDLALLDLDLPRMSGLELLKAITAMEMVLPVVALVKRSRVEEAVAAMKLGAFDCLPKPVNLARVRELVPEALRLRALALTLHPTANPPVFEKMVGASPRMRELFALIERVAPTDASVIIQGESGTGKELVARALHERSRRRDRRFLAINCAAVPRDLLENEFFGHEKGAFTGAIARREGAFELANHGTLFLDEIDEMPVELQAKLLRVLEEKGFRRLGGREEIEVDVRIIAATDKVMEELIRAGRFKEELFFRLNVVRLRVPPLRDHPEDIPLLVRAFLDEFTLSTGRRIRDLSPRAWALIKAHSWPGNVRDLRNAIERGVIASTGPVILPKDLPPRLRATPTPVRTLGLLLGLTLAEAERRFILSTLEFCQGNRSKAARFLQIGRRTLQTKLKSYGL